MAGHADGSIIVDTEIEKDGMKAGTKELEAAFRRTAKRIAGLSDTAKAALSKQMATFSKQNQAYEQQKQKVEALRSKLEELGEQKVETTEFLEIGKQIDADTVKLRKLEEAQSDFLNAGGKESSSAYKKRALKIEELRNSIKYAKAEQDELLNSGQAYALMDTSGVEDKLFIEEQKLQQMHTSLGASYEVLKAKMESYGVKLQKVAGIKGRLINALGKMKKAVKRAGSAMLGLNKKTKKTRITMGRMVMTSLILGTAMKAFYAVFGAIKDGFDNLAQYSKSANADISALTSALTRLKNSFATAFAPILSVVAPYLTAFMNMISKALTYVGMFIAALTGKDTFTKAVAIQEDYAAGLSDTADGAKKAEKALDSYLSPLDEINKLEKKETGTNKGNSVGGVSTSDMFEEVSIDSKVKAFAEKVKRYLSSVLQPLKKAITPLVSIISNGLRWAYENVLVPFGKWTIEKGLPSLINLLASAFEFLGVCLEGLQPLVQWLWEKVFKDLCTVIGDIVTGIMDILSGLLKFLTGAFSGDWNKAFDGLGQAVQGLQTIIFSVLDYVQNNVMRPFDKWLSEIFAHDWTKTFGVLGDSINAFMKTSKQHWDSVKQTFNGIITFIKGVFTGNWRQAWEGIKQILAGVWNGMVAVVKAPINGIIGLINGMINAIVSGLNHAIDAINRLHITVPDWVPVFGGESWGVHLSHISTPRIPYLAQGAVIPPNAPFMAMLGDQKNGNNLEMPESLLRRIVREETGGSKGGTQRFIAQINRRVLFDEMITEGKMRQSINGQNPFELA